MAFQVRSSPVIAKGAHALPFQTKKGWPLPRLSPTAQASVGLATKTPRRSVLMPIGEALHDRPASVDCRMRPASPTANMSCPPTTPEIARRFSVAVTLMRLQLTPFQRRIAALSPTATIEEALLPQTARKVFCSVAG